jgi:hypothetical protein
MSRPFNVHLFTLHDVSANVLPYTIADKLVSFGASAAIPSTPARNSIYFDTSSDNALWYSTAWNSFDKEQKEVVLGTSKPATLSPGLIFLDTVAGKPYWSNSVGSLVTFAAEVAPAAFTPSDAGTPLLWFDPNDPNCTTLVSGTARISQFGTSSAPAPVALSSVPTAATTNPTLESHPTYVPTKKWVRFNGTSGLSTANINAFYGRQLSYTFFVVGITTTANTDRRVFSISHEFSGTEHIASIRSNTSNGNQLDFYRHTTLLSSTSPSLTNAYGAPNTPFILCFHFYKESLEGNFRTRIHHNGSISGIVTTDTAGPTAFSPAVISLGVNTNGNGGFWTGYMGDFIVMSGTLSETNRMKIEGYLAHKWGLESVLPSTHPHKTTAP